MVSFGIREKLCASSYFVFCWSLWPLVHADGNFFNQMQWIGEFTSWIEVHFCSSICNTQGILDERKPVVDNFKNFRSIAYAHVSEAKTKKLDDGGEKCVFLGIRCHDPSLHPWRGRHLRIIDGFQTNPHTGWVQEED